MNESIKAAPTPAEKFLKNAYDRWESETWYCEDFDYAQVMTEYAQKVADEQTADLRNRLEVGIARFQELKDGPGQFCSGSTADHMQDLCECGTLEKFATEALKELQEAKDEPIHG